VQTYIREVLGYIRSKGRDAELVTPYSWGGPLIIPAFGARRFIQRINGKAGILWYRYWHYKFLKRALKRKLQDPDISVVFAQCTLSAKAALEARRDPSQKVIVTIHSDGSEADEWVDKKLLNRGSRAYRSIREIEQTVLPAVDGVVYVSQAAKRGMTAEVPDLRKMVASEVIHAFISMPPVPRSTERGADLVSVGGMEIAKNHEYLIRVLDCAKRMGHIYTLDIIGDGPCRRPLENLTRTLHLDEQVRFLGCRSDVRSRLPNYRVYVHASVRESLCLSIIEAMASGRAVIAGAVGGISELFDPETEGLFWPLDDADAAARIMVGLLEDDDRLRALGEAAKRRFERSFDPAATGATLEGFFASVSQGSSPPYIPSADADPGMALVSAKSSDPGPSDPEPPEPEPSDRGTSDGGGSAPVTDSSSQANESGARSTSKRAVITTLDQAFSSASNFVVGVAVARIAGPVGLGGFALAYACWNILAALHRSLITDPMAIENDAIHPEAHFRMRRGLASEVILALVTAACLVVIGIPMFFLGQRTFGLSLLAVIPWLPFLLVQDYWRWTGFMRREPGKALMNDTVFNIVQGACFVAVAVSGIHSVVIVIASWGAGATAGAFYGLWQFKVRPTMHGGIEGLRERFHLGKWLAANSIAGWASSQASVLLAGFILGPVGLGALRAAQTLVTGPALVLIQAGGSVGLPEASRALKDRGWQGLRRVSVFVSAMGVLSIGLVGAVVVVFGGQLLKLTYGPAFTSYWPASEFFSLGFLITSIGLGPILVLKTSRNTRALFRVQLISLAFSIVAVSVLAATNGVSGAAAASIIAGVVNVIGLGFYSRKARKELCENENSSDDQSAGDLLGLVPGPVPDISQIPNNDTPIAVEFG
ncbi:MAG: glycosyltransferase, partial [Acidimicrobiales bacterium]